MSWCQARRFLSRHRKQSYDGTRTDFEKTAREIREFMCKEQRSSCSFITSLYSNVMSRVFTRIMTKYSNKKQ